MALGTLNAQKSSPSIEPEVVWNVEWKLSDEAQATGESLSDIQGLLEGALILRPPERWLGIPFRHAWSKLNGKWDNALELGNPPPIGTASPYDGAMVERSQALLQSRLMRNGFLEASLSMDTIGNKGKVTLSILLDPGPRYLCGSTSVTTEGSGLTASDVALLTDRWAQWVGRPIDLIALDQERSSMSERLQSEGWFGLIADHFAIDIDTTGSRKSKMVHLGLKVLPIVQESDTLRHRRAYIDSLSFHWHPLDDGMDSLETRTEKGVLWKVPFGRDLRGLAHRMHLSPGDPYDPGLLSDARQSLRMLPLLQDVRLDISPGLVDSDDERAPLHVHLDAYPTERRIMRVNGALISRLGLGGEMTLSIADLDFRKRAEEISFDLGLGLETVVPYSSGQEGVVEPTPLNSRVLSAGVVYSTGRLIPFGPDRFPKSTRPLSRLSMTFRDESRPRFSRTYVQFGLVEGFMENVSKGSRIELRPFEIAMTASRLEPDFVQELENLGSDILTSSFESRALFGSSVDWRLSTPHSIRRPWKWSLNVELEGAGNLFHLIDRRAPEETTVPLPSAFGETADVQVARYIRWLLDMRGGWSRDGRNGIFGRCFVGVASSTIDGVAIPLEKQFYVGGPNSMRGWQALTLGPGGTDVPGLRVRGDIHAEFNLEFRRYVNDWIQLAAFTDAGNIWMTRPEESRPRVEFEFESFLSQTAASYGAGIRFDFEYFLLRCDFGRPWKWPDGSNSTDRSWRIHPAVSLPF